MIISGIVYVQLVPSNSPIVIGLLVAGFATLLIFGLWETFNKNLKEPLTPTRLFTANKGRTLTAPFVCGTVVTMFYYANSITWAIMVDVYFSNASTAPQKIYWLATVQGWGIFAGAMILTLAGNYIGRWRTQMVGSFTLMTLFGALAAYITPQREGLGITFSFLSALFYGWAQYVSIVFVQFGAEQTELGIAGGLAGVARSAGATIATTVFTTILTTTQGSWAETHVVAAAEAAGASPDTAKAVLAAIPLGAAALEQVQGLTESIIEAAGLAFVQSYVEGVK